MGKGIVTIKAGGRKIKVHSLRELERRGVIGDLGRMPYSIKVLVESLLRQRDGRLITDDDVAAIASWSPDSDKEGEIPFIPARVLLQDLTGGPAIVDLASMRACLDDFGLDPSLVNPLIPVDLVIDHSIHVDHAGSPDALGLNEELDFGRNAERYALFKWAQGSFSNFRVVPPGKGICHQVNLEYLSPLVHVKDGPDGAVAYPDSCFGTDSHTTQINGLGVVGWGVGGIEAEAVMLGQPCYMKIPEVVGFRLVGELSEGVTATDLVLTIVEILRERGVVGKFVEFCGPGYGKLDLADRATIANMGPEYGATMGFFPIDGKTIEFLRLTGRDPGHIEIVEAYAREQGLWYEGEAEYSETIELDLSTVVPSLAGHKRPQDRIPLPKLAESFAETLKSFGVESRREHGGLADGSIAIASITSCTNTANPSVMVAAGLVAKKAAALGLRPPAHVKTSLSPGSRAVTEYLSSAGLMESLEELGFHVTGYGCMTCIGNSGPLNPGVSEAINAGGLVAAAVASSNRNFEGRIHADVKANYLASPPLVVALAIAGRVDIDLTSEPLGRAGGKDVYLRDVWPTSDEIREAITKHVTPGSYARGYADVFEGSEKWKAVKAPVGPLFEWDDSSTYIRNPPFFEDISDEPGIRDVRGARALAVLGDSITTDHISPAGSFGKESDAGKYLMSKGVKPAEFNSYGARRANHEVMARGTFANVRLRNAMVPGKEGSASVHLPSGREGTIFETSEAYAEERTPLVVIAGKEYGTGSSRDWAAKGPLLLGVRAVMAESFERIHRSNLIGMGIVPLQFEEGQDAGSLGLTGREIFDISLSGMSPRSRVEVTAYRDGKKMTFHAVSRVDVPAEMDYVRNGGILQTVLRRMVFPE
ncbi:MAG: aconitate hydratase AcnA [Thermoplasmatales archaeon]|nr:aconitate hydratase AcnA [Thermoplasmatales archaeon]